MSDVIRFPRLARSSALTASGLTETDDACSRLDMAELYGSMDAGDGVDDGPQTFEANVSFLQQSHSLCTQPVGWTNQELADLYRTQRILALAGVTTQVDHGVTDEGDPWFVFMDSQNEVLVHFSRFDGCCLVTSQMQETPIKGDSLHDLVAEFSRRVQPVAQAGQNVVPLTKSNRDVVFIHPAAALAALVWSVYLMSDELIAATPATTASMPKEMGGSSHEDATGKEPVGHDGDQEVLSSAVQKASASQDIVKATSSSSSSREGLALGLSGHGAKAAGVSLSLVALAVGLPLPAGSILDITTDDSSTQKLSLESLSAALEHVKSKEAALLMASETIKLQQRDLGLAEVESEETAPEAPNIDSEAEVALVTKGPSSTRIKETEELSYAEPAQPVAMMSKRPPSDQDENAAEAPNEQPVQTPGAISSDSNVEEVSFLQSFDAAFESFEITSLDKIDHSELVQLLNTEETKSPSTPVGLAEKLPGYESFDLEAREFLDFLLHTYSNIKVVNLNTEIIFIHMDAFEGGSNAPEIYAKSWSYDDGGVVSTIGLKSDMAQFDLIA